MNNYWAFAPMRASNELLSDTAALRERMDEEGYLYLRGLIDSDRIAALRSEMLAVLVDQGWTRADLGSARPQRPPVREGDEEYFEAYDEIQKLESFHSLAHDAALMEVMREVLGGTAFPHPLKVARLAFPGAPEVSTPPHQDYLNNQGTQTLTAAWIPVGDCPMEHGTLAILRGSNRFGVLPLQFHLGAGNRRAVLPAEMQERLRWVTTDMAAGDVLLFGALTVHAALNNAMFDMRLSVDFRYQPEGEELTELVLEPHFGRLSWEEIYAGWDSDELKYYWRDLDYQVVPYDTSEFEASEPSEEEVIRVLVYEQFRERRHQTQRESEDRASGP
jgi:ectoine hydroxylase-related dioxygenase (phytanoyl-CoA dioxygenase family)